jgi:hypothetical protein
MAYSLFVILFCVLQIHSKCIQPYPRRREPPSPNPRSSAIGSKSVKAFELARWKWAENDASPDRYRAPMWERCPV